MVRTHTNTLARAKRVVALVLSFALLMNDVGQVAAITYDSSTSTYFDSIDDFGLATGSDSIALQFGGTLGQYLRYNRSIGRFVFSDDLDVQGTISGWSLRIMGSASISGTLALEGSTTLSGAALRGFGLNVDCDTAGTSKLLWDATTGRFSCGTDQGTTYTAGQGLSLNGTSFRVNDTLTGSLARFSTVSGSTIFAKDTLASSGSIILKSTTGNADMFVTSTVAHVNGYFDAATGNNAAVRLRENSSTKWSLLTQGTTDNFIIAGDGGMAVDDFVTITQDGNVGMGPGSAMSPKAKLAVTGTISGTTLYAIQSFSGAGLTTCSNGTTSKLLWNSTTGRFSCGTDQGTTYTAGQGLNLSTTSFRLNATVTGAVIQAANSLASSGALSWKGTATGAALNAAGGRVTVSQSGASFFNTGLRNVDFGVFGQTNNALFYVDASGSGTAATASGGIGIGTRTPVTQLHVAGRVPTRPQSTLALGTAPVDVEIQGKLAYIIDQSGNLKIADVSNASSPIVLSTLATGLAPADVVVQGKYAYVNGGLTFKIIDVSNPASPSIVSTAPQYPGAAGTLAVSGPYLYSVDATATLTPYDVSNPYAPEKGTTATLGGDIVVQGEYLYGADGTNLRVFSLRNPMAPVLVGSLAIANATSLAVQGRYAYVGRYGSSAFDVVDVSNPASPTLVGTMSLGTNPQHVAVQGRYAYVTDFIGFQLHVIDVSVPNAPRLLGSANSGGSPPYTVAVSGRYGYVVNRDSNNMVIFDLGGAYIQQFEAGGAEVGSLTVRTDFEAVEGTIQGGLAAGRLFVFGNMAASGALKIAQGFNAGSGNIVFSRSGSVVFNEQSRPVDFRIETDNDQNALMVDASTDRLGIGTSAPKTKLDVVGAVSGSFIYATRSFSGAGLTSCSNATTSKLLWDATTGRFSCGTDQTGGGSLTAGQGLSLNGTTLSLSQSISGSLLEFQVVSGSTLYGTKTVASSGVILVENMNSGDSTELIIADSASSEASQVFMTTTSGHDKDADGLYFGAFGTNGFLVNRETGPLLLGTSGFAQMQFSAGNVMIGDNVSYNSIADPTIEAKLEVNGTVSGASLFTSSFNQNTGLSDCDNATTSKLLWDSTTGRFSCGTDQTGGSSGGGMAYATASGIFLKRSGGTMTGTLRIEGRRGMQSGALLIVSRVGSGSHSATATNATLFSVDQMALGQLEGGAFFGRVGLKENQWGLANYGNTWTAKESNRAWVGIAMSSDGKIQTTAENGGPIYVSTDYGNTWTTKDSARSWGETMAMSGDGKIQTAVVTGGQIYVSTDYGNTWAAKNSARSWKRNAMSSDGKIQTAIVSNGQIYISTDYGNTWTAKESVRNWHGIAVSSDGKLQTAAVWNGQIYISTDYGNTWTAKESVRNWINIAMSSDGKVQTATVSPGQIYVSTDYGNTWTAKESSRSWIGIAMSSDGKVQTATTDSSGQIYVSTDYGNTWAAKESNRNWSNVAMSSDGKIQTTVVYNGKIYVSYADSYQYGSIAIGTGSVKGDVKLMVQGIFSGVTLYATRSFSGAGLSDCDTAGTSKLLWDATTGRFSCGTDAGSYATASGIFLKRSGGTMTGTLNIQNGNAATYAATPLLNVRGAMSGQQLRIFGSGVALTVSGGTIVQVPGRSARTMSGIDLNANVNNVFVSGNYVYTVSDAVAGNEFRAIDVANPNAPVIVGGIDTGQNTKALFVSTRHAFIGMNGAAAGSGMYIIDNSNPGAPRIISRLNFGTAVNSLYVSGKYVYAGLNAMTSGVCSAKYQTFTGCDFAIIDFTNANIPRVIGGLQIGANVNQVYIQNRYAYLALDSVSGNDFRIIDLVNPLDPVAVGGLDVSNNVKSVFSSGKYAFIGLSTDASTEFRVIDVSNKSSPASLGGTEFGTTVDSITVTGDWARLGLASVSGNDYVTVDLRAPASPSVIGGINYGTDVNSVAVAGKYAYLGLNSVTLNDMVIVDLSGIESPAASIGSLFTANLAVSDNVRFDNNAYIRNALNVGRGGIISKGPLAIQSTGTGSAKAGTGQLTNAFDVRNGTGQHLFSVSENGTVQAGIPSFSTGTMMIALNMMSRRSGYCTPLITSATTYTAVGMSTCTVNGTAAAWPAGGRMKLRIAGANTANAMAGVTTVFTETRPQFRPKILFDVTTGTGTTGVRFYGGIVESSTAAQALTIASAASTIDYVALAWEDGISGTQWLCCSGDGTNHSCQSMGVPVQTNTEYMGQVDWSQPGKVTCSLQVRDKTYRTTKTTNISVNNVSLGENVVLVNKTIGGAVSRVMYNSRLVLEQN